MTIDRETFHFPLQLASQIRKSIAPSSFCARFLSIARLQFLIECGDGENFELHCNVPVKTNISFANRDQSVDESRYKG